MKKIIILLLILVSFFLLSKEKIDRVPIKIKVIETTKNVSVDNVCIINMMTYRGGITDKYGELIVNCKEGDSLLISKLGYQKERIYVTGKNTKESIFYMYVTLENYELNEVTVKSHNLTGVLDVDLKIVEQRSYPAYLKLRGIKTKDEISKNTKDYGYGGVIGYFYNKFSRRVKELEKLDNVKKDDDGMYALLSKRNDRELVSEVSGLEKEAIEQILIENGYPVEFIIKATDLEIMNALKDSYKKRKK